MSRMPPDSNWKMPLVKPLVKISYVFASSSGKSSMTSSTPRCFSIRRLRVFDDRERRQAEEVHLEKAELLEAAHVVLRDDFVLVRLVKRDEFLQRRRRDDDAGGVDRRVARHAFQLAGDVEHLADARVCLAQLRRSPAPARTLPSA